MRKGKISIEYYSVLRDLIKNIWVVFLCLLIGLMGIYIAEYSIYKPEYTSTATVVVNLKGSSSHSMSTYSISSEMAEVFSNVFSEPTMEKAAAEYLGLEDFDGEITAKVPCSLFQLHKDAMLYAAEVALQSPVPEIRVYNK